MVHFNISIIDSEKLAKEKSKNIFFKNFLNCIYFAFGCAGYSLLCMGFLQLQGVGSTLQLRVAGFSVAEHGLKATWASVAVAIGLQSVRASAVGAHRLKCPATCGIFLDYDQTHVTCICRQILNNWTTRNVLRTFLYDCNC